MPQCIYREVPLNFDDPANADTASLEHIISWALGGSNQFTVNDASRRANNDLGSSVDAPFANTLPLAIKRHKLRLEGQAGNIPPIVWSGISPEGAIGKIIINCDGTVELELDTKVDRPKLGESGLANIQGPSDSVERILMGMLKGMKKRNETAYSTDGQLLQSLEDFLDASEQQFIDKMKLRVKYFDPDAWTRGILKIALAAGHKILGPEWTFGPNAAVLRQTVMNTREQWPSSPRGFIAGELDRNLCTVLGKTAEVRDANMHTVAVLPMNAAGQGMMAISLFGGDGVPEALLQIGPLPGSFVNAIDGDQFASTIVGYRIDPRTRCSTAITFGQIDRRLARLGPTNKKTRDL